MAEALMSGTPVICSDRGACPELVTPEVGFVCGTREDYIDAIGSIAEISPAACREDRASITTCGWRKAMRANTSEKYSAAANRCWGA